MEKKLTAVEWLVNVVQSCIAPNYIPKEIIEQAKEMEREQKYTEQEMLDYGKFCVQCEKQGFIIPTNKTE